MSIQIIGHRGAAGLELENTIKSIKKAIEIGLQWIEIDVVNTTDNKIFVFHDKQLDRLSSKEGLISNISSLELQKITLKDGSHIPTLEEVANIAKKNNVKLLVELKDENAVEETKRILSEIFSYEDFIIGSFYHKVIKELKEQNPLIQTSIMLEGVPVELKEYLEKVNPDYVTISIETYNEYLIDTIKAQKRKLVFYTVNTIELKEQASKVNPFAIITDFPNLLI